MERIFSARRPEGDTLYQQTHRQVSLTAQNLKTNNPWGDILAPKEENVTRIYALNVNGLSLDKRGGQFDTLCIVAKETQADILCCQEHNIDTTQAEVKRIIHQTTKQHWQWSRISFSNSPIPFSGFYKPGGTLSMTLNHLTGRVVQQTEDKWGRWVSQTLQGRNGRRLTIINVYQVVNKNYHRRRYLS
jgi:exonuclease III